MPVSDRGALPGSNPLAEAPAGDFKNLLSKPRNSTQALSQDLRDLLDGKPVRIPSWRVPQIKKQLRNLVRLNMFPNAESALFELENFLSSTFESVDYGSTATFTCGTEGTIILDRATFAYTALTGTCTSPLTGATGYSTGTFVSGHSAYTPVSNGARYNVTRSLAQTTNPALRSDQAIQRVDFGPRAGIGPSSQLTLPNIKPGWLNDPNVMRTIQVAAKRDESPAPGSSEAPVEDFAPYQARAIEPGTAPRRIYDITKRQPPGAGERERKSLSKSAKLGKLLFEALDNVSESCETVDAIFKTLPKKTQRKWEKAQQDHAAFGNENGGTRQSLLDNAGQYGLDGCDWKAQAIWYNTDKIDMCKSVENIIKNYFEDKVIGGIQARLPSNYGNTTSEGDKLFAKWLNDRLDRAADTIGLCS